MALSLCSFSKWIIVVFFSPFLAYRKPSWTLVGPAGVTICECPSVGARLLFIGCLWPPIGLILALTSLVDAVAGAAVVAAERFAAVKCDLSGESSLIMAMIVFSRFTFLCNLFVYFSGTKHFHRKADWVPQPLVGEWVWIDHTHTQCKIEYWCGFSTRAEIKWRTPIAASHLT